MNISTMMLQQVQGHEFGHVVLRLLVDHHECGKIRLLRVKDRFGESFTASWSDVDYAVSDESPQTE